MKICIVTITNSCNFGGRLQNYALQEVLKVLFPDATVHTAINVASDIKPLRYPFVYRLFEAVFSMRIAKQISDKCVRISLLGKKIRFMQFNKKRITRSKYYLNKGKVRPGFALAYDFYVCGSDQIWNPDFHFSSDVEYLPSVAAEKKIAYAASFGVQHLNKEQFDFANGNIRTFAPDRISVREEAALDILQQMGVNDAVALLDPTLVLEPQKWFEVEKKTDFSVPDRYVLIYMLGSAEKDEAKKYAKDHGFIPIDLGDQSQYDYYATGPEHFVYLIHNATAVFTDSFHAMVFSIIFKRELHIYYRQGMTSRIETLFRKVQREYALETRVLKDYEGIDVLLEKERKAALEFLRRTLSC